MLFSLSTAIAPYRPQENLIGSSFPLTSLELGSIPRKVEYLLGVVIPDLEARDSLASGVTARIRGSHPLPHKD